MGRQDERERANGIRRARGTDEGARRPQDSARGQHLRHRLARGERKNGNAPRHHDKEMDDSQGRQGGEHRSPLHGLRQPSARQQDGGASTGKQACGSEDITRLRDKQKGSRMAAFFCW